MAEPSYLDSRLDSRLHSRHQLSRARLQPRDANARVPSPTPIPAALFYSRTHPRRHPRRPATPHPPCLFSCKSPPAFSSPLFPLPTFLTPPCFSHTFRTYLGNQDGRSLSSLLSPSNPENHSFAYVTNHAAVRSLTSKELTGVASYRISITDKGQKAWVDVIAAFWEVVYEIERGDTGRQTGEDGELGYWGRAYAKQSNFTTYAISGRDGLVGPGC